ncbi:hypothetical protein [Actinokineospora sp. NBRC 105648]|uniref:SCO4225 family membrane protein n=1 Tax=Actinokineospora sp. NBRC 105648 TaxID=3032206 RepID=UPI0025579CFD|nr:hypothetical protein [Actinokineospora sp. NBRC 105648]
MAWSNQRVARKVVLGYIGTVVVVFAVVAVVLATRDSSADGSFASVAAVVVTLPASLVIILLPQFPLPWNGVVASVVLVGAALLQAWVLWLMFRGRRLRP